MRAALALPRPFVWLIPPAPLPWRLWGQRHKTRAALARLDPALYADIGLTPDQARAEAARPFWRG